MIYAKKAARDRYLSGLQGAKENKRSTVSRNDP
jgi:hypothetical protein